MVVAAKPRHLNISGQPIDGSEFHVTVYSNYMHPIEVLPWIIMFKEQNTPGNYKSSYKSSPIPFLALSWGTSKEIVSGTQSKKNA